jgi:glycosyltransferase involved in cell wall biosynthesis
MRIGIIGTRGIPNYYGGFEQFAEYLSAGLVKKGHQVVVYNSSDHPYQKSEWNGVSIQHCKDWEGKIGTAGQFFYDLNCILNSRKQNFDILLQLGYTSSSVWKNLLPKHAIVITNMDGLEWKRSKFTGLVQNFLKMAERWAVASSDHLVADSKGIRAFIKNKYNVDSTFIAYGSDLFDDPDATVLNKYKLKEQKYHMLIARMEPENNIETILDGMTASSSEFPFLVIGKTENAFGQHLVKKFEQDNRIQFLGGIYDLNDLNNLRYFSNYYFHGHSVGGTNPSLLEAMASSAFIVAHENEFNGAVLEGEALYFETAQDVTEILNQQVISSIRTSYIHSNRLKIEELYTWEKIINSYEDLFLKLANQK